MPRTIALIAAVFLVALPLAGCGGDDETTTTSTATTTATGASGATGATGDAEVTEDVEADAKAKATARTAQTAVEVYATDNNGSYEGVTPEYVEGLEPDAAGVEVEGTDDGYSVTATSESGVEFTVERDANGKVTMTCSEPGVGGCDENGEW